MNYQVQFDRYQYPFPTPLKTHHGLWEIREGIIITLTNNQGLSYQGEIAPLEWFGTESIDSALTFCHSLQNQITSEGIYQIPDQLPCCQFAFYLTLQQFKKKDNKNINFPLNYSYLLPAGNKGISVYQALTHNGLKTNHPKRNNSKITTFKWKIAVYSLEEELKIFQDLIKKIPPAIKLRLDANGGLTFKQAKQWLSLLDHYPQVEYLEQPLSPQYFAEMQELAEQYQTNLALDESVANYQQLDHYFRQGWKGIFIVKPAIAGYPFRLENLLAKYPLDLVFSTVFETNIGRQGVFTWLQNLGYNNRALGYGPN